MSDREARMRAVEAAVERLQSALAAVGAPPLRAPQNASAVRDVAAAVAPWGLPVEVDQFWCLVDGSSTGVTCFPHPHAAAPDFALECWNEHRRQPGMTPDLLLPVCYESHAFLLVELDGPEGAGGACFTWAYAGQDSFMLVAADLVDYLEVAAETLEAGHVERLEHEGRVFHDFDDDAFHEALRERLRRAPHPRYGDRAEIGWHPTSWPDHWLSSVGPAAKERDALGVTTTIAAIAAKSSSTATAGRVHALVRELCGSSEGVRVTVDDGTGRLHVWCPAAVTMFGPACDERYEFDLVVTDDAPHAAQAEAVAVRVIA